MTQRQEPKARDDRIREGVRRRYGGIVTGTGCCGSSASSDSCCSSSGGAPSLELGYTKKELAEIPKAAVLGLGCGNPTALASLKRGETVLDLGSGAGIDCFLAAKRIGAKGRAIGVDMTPEMVSKARENARKGRYPNVEFRLGEIEHLPVEDASVDVVISNCVVNLAPDKDQVYREAFRVLRPGGRLAISDMVATRPLTAKEQADPELWGSCSSGALEVGPLKLLLKRAGFRPVQVDLKILAQAPDSLRDQARIGVVSADISAIKPKGR